MGELSPKVLETAAEIFEAKLGPCFHSVGSIDAKLIVAFREALDEAGLVERSELDKEIEQCHAKETCCCGDYIKGHGTYAGHSPVSMYDYALDGAITERDEARLARDELHAAQHREYLQVKEQGKQLAALREALEPFSRAFTEPIMAKECRTVVEVLADTAKAAALYQRMDEWREFVRLVIHACREASRWRMKDGSECWCNRGEPSHSPGCKALAAAYSEAQILLAAEKAGAPEPEDGG